MSHRIIKCSTHTLRSSRPLEHLGQIDEIRHDVDKCSSEQVQRPQVCVFRQAHILDQSCDGIVPSGVHITPPQPCLLSSNTN